jgi:hypothetical protein
MKHHSLPLEVLLNGSPGKVIQIVCAEFENSLKYYTHLFTLARNTFLRLFRILKFMNKVIL